MSSMLQASYKHARSNRLRESYWQVSSASRGRHAASQPIGEAVEGSRRGRICRSGLWDLHDDWIPRARGRALCRRHAFLVIPVSLPQLPLEDGLIGRDFLADVDTAMKLSSVSSPRRLIPRSLGRRGPEITTSPLAESQCTHELASAHSWAHSTARPDAPARSSRPACRMPR